jgi:hypothetical protein
MQTNRLCDTKHPVSQMFGPLIRLANPSLQTLLVPNSESHLERLGLRGQRRGNAVARKSIQDRLILWILRRHELERCDHSKERRIDLSIGQMRSYTHSTACSVPVVRCATTLGVVEVSFRLELGRIFEMGCHRNLRPKHSCRKCCLPE